MEAEMICRGCFDPEAEHKPEFCLRGKREKDRLDAKRYRKLKVYIRELRGQGIGILGPDLDDSVDALPGE